MNTLKNKLKKRLVNLGTWQTIPSNSISQILSKNNLDWIAIDIEHTSINFSHLDNLVDSILINNVSPLVRLSENNYNTIKKVMDIGFHGVIIPNIINKKDAESVVEAIYYPPKGNRGMGLYRAQNFGDNLYKYLDWVKNNSIIILQIENVKALNNIESIFSIKEIDGYFIGPYDLSASMGIPGKFEDKDFQQTLNHIIEVANKYKKSIGIHSVSTDPKKIIKYIDQGFTILGYSMDTISIKETYNKNIEYIKNKFKKNK